MRQAIIDIGSNAIRAVVYDNQKLGAPEIYNDKFRNDLVTLLDLEDINIKHPAYLTLQYFNNIFHKLDVSKVNCVATAVLRDHPRAQEFTKLVREKYAIEIDVISGEREAYLTAAGLISGVTDADGIAADLGGGSLEIVEIANKKVGYLRSLPLGTKRIDASVKVEELAEIISAAFVQDKTVDQGADIQDSSIKNLYLIGGAFRFIGRHYMDFVRYPLKNLHNLEIDGADFQIYLEQLDSIAKIKSSYQVRRLDERAILAVRALMQVLNPDKIVISNYGLKEGVRFASLDEEEQSKDIIFERCKTLAHFDESACRLNEYRDLISFFLIEPDKLALDVIDLTVILGSFSKNIDRTLKANFTAEFILSSDIPFNHRQRLMLAMSSSYAFSSKSDLYINKLARKVLPRVDYYNSQIIGNIIRITREVDGPEFKSPSFSLQLHERYIEITADEILPKPVFDTVCERLKDISYARKAARSHIQA